MKEPKKFLVPPNLQKRFLIFGMTLPELAATVFLLFFALKQLLDGFQGFIILPIISVLLFIRPADSDINLLTILLRRSRFYLIPQIFSLKGSDSVVSKNRH